MTATSKSSRWKKIGRHTGTLALVLIFGIIGMSTQYGIAQLSTRLEPTVAPPAAPFDEGIGKAIQESGITVKVSKGHGFWAERRPDAEIMIQRAVPSGLPRDINLCLQLKNLPDELYPITLAGTWAEVEQGKAKRAPSLTRAPVAVGDSVAEGMPRLSIRGHYHGELTATLNATKAARWTVMFAEAIDKNQYRLGKETWLLWGGAETGEASPYTHAIRIRRRLDVPQDNSVHCANEATERLEWQLYVADPRIGTADSPAEIIIRSTDADIPGRLRLSPGQHRIPRYQPMELEDKLLFERALAQGLIRHQHDETVAIVPPDLARASTLPAAWKDTNPNDKKTKQLLKALHRSPNGKFVREQIAEFNASRQWLAIRIRGDNEAATWGKVSNWQAESKNQQLVLSNRMPDVSARLFEQLPVGWSPWIRVASWPETNTSLNTPAPVRLNLTPPGKTIAGIRIEMLILGNLQSVSGARVIENLPACNTAACPGRDMLSLVRLQLEGGTVTLNILPETRFNKLRPERTDAKPIQARNGKAVWVANSRPATENITAATVSLATADGLPLFDRDHALPDAHRLGIAGLVGLSQVQPGSLAEMLGRLGRFGATSTHARLTLDSHWQSAAHAILDCVGYQQGTWEAQTSQCLAAPEHTTIPTGRVASLALLDAKNGNIIAVAGAPALPAGVDAGDAIAFDRFNPTASPLRTRAWQHDGGRRFGAGSTFKLVDALGLEFWASGNPKRQQELEGLTTAHWETLGKAAGFSMQSGRYPAHAHHSIANFEGRPATHALRNSRFGLAEALEKSVNTWFSWMIERTDQTADKAPDVIPLGHNALQNARPIIAIAHRLGFEQSQQLDGGLLPKNFPWQAGDHLQTVASRFDPIRDRHQIRSLAIGQRMAVTALQMAGVSAAIATGNITTPRLLASMDGRFAEANQPPPLTLELARIRQGMKAVVDSGTAASAFSAPELDAIRPAIYGKTGSAEMGEQDSKTICSPDRNGQPRQLKVAWFVGYIAAGTLPRQPNPLAFAVSISHTCETGGAHAARVVASLLQVLHEDNQTA